MLRTPCSWGALRTPDSEDGSQDAEAEEDRHDQGSQPTHTPGQSSLHASPLRGVFPQSPVLSAAADSGIGMPVATPAPIERFSPEQEPGSEPENAAEDDTIHGPAADAEGAIAGSRHVHQGVPPPLCRRLLCYP